MATVATWTHLSVTWCVHCLSFLNTRIFFTLILFSKVSEHCYLETLARLYVAVCWRRLNFGMMLWSCIMTMSMTFVQNLLTMWSSTIFGTETFGCSKSWRLLWWATDFQTVSTFRYVSAILKSIRKKGFQQYFYKWKHHLIKCTGVQGDNIKGTIGTH